MTGVSVPGRDLGRDLAQDLAELALEVPHAGLTRVVGDDAAQRVFGHDDFAVAQAVAAHLPIDEMVACDRHLLVLGVAVEAHDLHAVEQRAGDGLHDVRRRDEQHVGQVEIDLEVVITEAVVLCGVEHLEQRRTRVAAPVGADLVDLVEEEDGVHRPGLGDGPDDATGLRADVRAAVSTDLGLVTDATERDANELASEGRAPPTRRVMSCRRPEDRPER